MLVKAFLCICISEKPIVAPPLDAVEYGDIQGIEEVFN